MRTEREGRRKERRMGRKRASEEGEQDQKLLPKHLGVGAMPL